MEREFRLPSCRMHFHLCPEAINHTRATSKLISNRGMGWAYAGEEVQGGGGGGRGGMKLPMRSFLSQFTLALCSLCHFFLLLISSLSFSKVTHANTFPPLFFLFILPKNHILPKSLLKLIWPNLDQKFSPDRVPEMPGEEAGGQTHMLDVQCTQGRAHGQQTCKNTNAYADTYENTYAHTHTSARARIHAKVREKNTPYLTALQHVAPHGERLHYNVLHRIALQQMASIHIGRDELSPSHCLCAFIKSVIFIGIRSNIRSTWGQIWTPFTIMQNRMTTIAIAVAFPFHRTVKLTEWNLAPK